MADVLVDAAVTMPVADDPVLVFVDDVELLFAGALEDDLKLLSGQRAQLRLKVEAVRLGDSRELTEDPVVARLAERRRCLPA
jgi:hypothetical protein